MPSICSYRCSSLSCIVISSGKFLFLLCCHLELGIVGAGKGWIDLSRVVGLYACDKGVHYISTAGEDKFEHTLDQD